LVAKNAHPNRSRAIQSAVAEKLARMEHGRLASECAKLDANFEKALAEEGLGREPDDLIPMPMVGAGAREKHPVRTSSSRGGATAMQRRSKAKGASWQGE
jgi:hypothetical protein